MEVELYMTSFCMWLKLSVQIECYNFKLFYVIAMVSTKNISIEYLQKWMSPQKKQWHTKEGSKRGMERQKSPNIQQTINKMVIVSPYQ